MNEEWKAIPGYEGYYEVSDQGRVRSLSRKIPDWRGGFRSIKGMILKLTESGTGYLHVTLRRGGTHRTFSVHRLVLHSFVGPCPAGLEGCHNDDNKSNNRLSNLRWDSKSANHLDKVSNGRNPNSNKTHCPQGHPYSPENTYRSGRTRICRTCRRARNANRNQQAMKLNKEKAS